MPARWPPRHPPIVARRRPRLRLLAPGVVIGLAVLNLPALFDGGFVDPALERDQDPPSAWRQAAAALDAGSTEHRVMQLPGAEFGAFRWGYTVDPTAAGADREAVDHPRPAAARVTGGDGPAVRARRPRPVEHPRPCRDRARGAVLRRRHDLGQQRHGLRPVPHASPGAHPRDVRCAAGWSRRARAHSARPRPTFRHWQMLDETALANATIGAPVAPGRARRGRRPSRRWCERHRVSSCWPAAAMGSSTPRQQGCCTATRRCCTRPTSGTPTTHLDDADLVIITDSNRDRAHQWRGTQDVVGFTETGGPQARRAATRHGGSTSARVRRPGSRPPDDRGRRGAGGASDRATASPSPIGRRIDRRWRSTAIRRPRGWSATGSIRSDRASKCRAMSRNAVVAAIAATGCVADDLRRCRSTSTTRTSQIVDLDERLAESEVASASRYRRARRSPRITIAGGRRTCRTAPIPGHPPSGSPSSAWARTARSSALPADAIGSRRRPHRWQSC